MIVTIVSFIIVFSIVTVAHELGHLVFSRMAGIKVLEFGLGIGPRLCVFKGKVTKYTLNLFPIGGFVRIAGLDEEVTDPDEKFKKSESYLSKAPGQKFLSIFGGPLFNLVLAIMIFFFMFAFTGVPKDVSNTISTVAPASEAQNVGILPGDKLVAINGIKYEKAMDAVKTIHDNPGKRLSLTIERDGKTIKTYATPRLNKKLNIGLLGISLKPIYVKTDIINALYQSILQMFLTCGMILYTLGLLVIGKISLFDLAGPVGIAQFTGQVAGEGLVPLLSFTAFLSINLGLFNLLPIPALDGGRLVFIVIEKIKGKPVDQDLENKIHQTGFALLLALMALVTVNDIVRIIRR
jgi:regulator of sigma E protease